MNLIATRNVPRCISRQTSHAPGVWLSTVCMQPVPHDHVTIMGVPDLQLRSTNTLGPAAPPLIPLHHFVKPPTLPLPSPALLHAPVGDLLGEPELPERLQQPGQAGLKLVGLTRVPGRCDDTHLQAPQVKKNLTNLCITSSSILLGDANSG
jgi:hypothetical protein